MVGRNGKWGYVDAQGREVIPLQYAEPPKIHADIPRLVIRKAPPYPVYRDGKWSLVDENGKSVASRPLYEISVGGGSVEPIICGRSGTTWGCVNALGQDVVAFDNEAADGPFPNGFVSIKRNGKWGTVDASGKILIEPTLQLPVFFFRESTVASVKLEDGRFGLIDRNGKEVGKNRYAEAGTPAGDIWPVFTDKHWALADLQGVVIRHLDSSIGGVMPFSEGLAGASTQDYARGFIDAAGKWVVPPIAETKANQVCTLFSGGLCLAGSVNGFRGVKNRTGRYTIAPVFQLALVVTGLILAQYESETWLLDKSGHVVWPSEKRSLDPTSADSGRLYASQWQVLRVSNGSTEVVGAVMEFSENGWRLSSKGRTQRL